MNWFWLYSAILMETTGTITLKYSDGFRSFWIGVLALLFYLASLILLCKAMESLPVGMVYAIWGGVGTILVVCAGTAAFGETLTTARAICIVLIIAGVIGLHLFGGERRAEPVSPAEAAAAQQNVQGSDRQ